MKVSMCEILEKKLDEQKQQAANDTPCQEVTKPDPPKGREGKGRSHSDSSSSLKQEPVINHSCKSRQSVTLLASDEKSKDLKPPQNCQQLHSCIIVVGCCVSLCDRWHIWP